MITPPLELIQLKVYTPSRSLDRWRRKRQEIRRPLQISCETHQDDIDSLDED